MPVEFEEFAEQFQSWLAANADFTPALVVARNFTLGNLLNIQDIELYLGSKILLTMFEEPGTLQGAARRTRQERTFRFLYKGAHGQEAMNHCWRLLKFLHNKKTFETDDFRAWLARIDKPPGVVAAGEDGTHLADCVVTLNVWYKFE